MVPCNHLKDLGSPLRDEPPKLFIFLFAVEGSKTRE